MILNKYLETISSLMDTIGHPVRLMEVCGTHTVAIFRHGIRNLLPSGIKLLSGPGCPVCVTSIHDVDKAIAISKCSAVIITTFGDMMRVPGTGLSLFDSKAEGSDIRIVYSPLDALKVAEENPESKVVFFATGFETTSPLVAGTLLRAEEQNIRNFYIYPVHKTVPPALKVLLASGEVMVDGFILPGHVSAIIGSTPYEFIPRDYGKPSVITGFDAEDILLGVAMILEQIVSKKAEVRIQYTKVVRKEGNTKAISILNEFFGPEDAEWRGIGIIPSSGLKLVEKFRHRDIRTLHDPAVASSAEPAACSCGDVLKGIKMPSDCRLFGKTCTPDRPVGACMVSSEGSCAAYFKYRTIAHISGMGN